MQLVFQTACIVKLNGLVIEIAIEMVLSSDQTNYNRESIKSKV